jgi:hypothetical protein
VFLYIFPIIVLKFQAYIKVFDPFELICVQGVRDLVSQSSTYGYPIFPTAFVEEAVFPPMYVFTPLLNLTWL